MGVGQASAERRNRRALGQASLHRGSAFGFRAVFTAKNSADQKVWKIWKVSAALNSRIESDWRWGLWFTFARTHHTLVASGLRLFWNRSWQQLIHPGGIEWGETHRNASLCTKRLCSENRLINSAERHSTQDRRRSIIGSSGFASADAIANRLATSLNPTLLC